MRETQCPSACISMSIPGLHQPSLSNWPKLRCDANRLSRCSPLYFIESNTSAGHCPAINHRLRAAWGEWGDVAWCISHMLDSWAHCEYLQDTSETINCYLNPEATKSLKGIWYPLYKLRSPSSKPWGQQSFIRMIWFYVVFLDDSPPRVTVQC